MIFFIHDSSWFTEFGEKCRCLLIAADPSIELYAVVFFFLIKIVIHRG